MKSSCGLSPLRDREGDVLILARNFLAYYNDRYACQYLPTPENERKLHGYGWPGNVRELANAIEREVVLASGGILAFALEEPGTQGGVKSGLAMKDKKQAVEREEILRYLELNRWNKTQTAESPGISRRSLLYKIKEFGIA